MLNIIALNRSFLFKDACIVSCKQGLSGVPMIEQEYNPVDTCPTDKY